MSQAPNHCQRHAMTEHPLDTWHRLVSTQDPAGLNTLLAEDAVFYSPVVHTPQRGRSTSQTTSQASLAPVNVGVVVESVISPAMCFRP